ncbi:MAG: potassium-transporting ATPase subunit KdpA [Nitrospiraceae bacterium]
MRFQLLTPRGDFPRAQEVSATQVRIRDLNFDQSVGTALAVKQDVRPSCHPCSWIAHLSARRAKIERVTATEQILAVGPVASRIPIKQLGAKGGGFFNAKAAHRRYLVTELGVGYRLRTE